MTSSDATDSGVRALRDALVPAIERDLAGPRRRVTRRAAAPLAVFGTLLAGTGGAAATGVLFDDPKPNRDVPAVAEWMYFSHLSHSPEGPDLGPVLVRPKPEALARTNRATEEALRERGITARCGAYEGHPLACHLPGGEPVPAPEQAEALASLEGADVLESSPANYDMRRLTDAEARRWLCEHPDQRPAGVRPPEDC
jgi:hypothetical protein